CASETVSSLTDRAPENALDCASATVRLRAATRMGVNRDTFYSYFPRARANSIAAKP
ncbi:hypothetical protein QO001_005744, partial [Methylobacterium brachiatum]|nr:hypothetical protein [Methylobacterium brachiatum]